MSHPQMRGDRMDIDEVRATQVRLLTDFSSFCDRHGLRYMLVGGTLLGAVRHGGFIPWDDDIDLMMPRPDYERLRQVASVLAEETSGELRSACGLSDPYPYPYAKFHDPRTTLIERSAIAIPVGVNIDIFPLDGWPTGKWRRQIRRWCLGRLADVLRLKSGQGRRLDSLPRPVLWLIGSSLRLIPVGVVVWAISVTAMRTRFDTAMLAGIACWGVREQVPIRTLLPAKNIRFEALTVRAPVEPAAWLTAVYGPEFQTPPPVEERESTHNFDAYRRPLADEEERRTRDE